MELNKILDKKETTELDRITCFIYEGVSRLHDKNIPIGDMKEIKLTIGKIWRKHFPLDTLIKANSNKPKSI